MKKNLTVHFCLLFTLLIFIAILILLKKQQVYTGSVFIQEYIDEDGTVTADLYLISNKSLNISLIDYIILETNQGNMYVYSSNLEYSDSLIKISINNIGSIKYPSNNVLIFGEKISLLSYLLSNVF
ncbi:hypothetical protein [Spiroplasma cantharicola]|uniref:Uncharacterized protein n=1 Tax=Spiroplasma cantharicola TaxID=362837 RepID=A0A0M4JIX5_9MOLU|nr:hypothetical protein [Spiroplasma cantharicola]ALD66641.1 hypothetical protein SCANT_v1c07350 [Spiroplasma cantharicola]